MNPSPLIDWMRERQRIYRRKEANDPKPWTNDKVLGQYRFCNVFRELDKVTIWIRDNWRIPYAHHPNLAFAMGIARMFNKPETLEIIGFPENVNEWDYKEVIRKLEVASKTDTIFSAAYIISPSGSTKPKLIRVVEDYLVPYFLGTDPIVNDSLEATWENICKYEGFGKFMAYEVVTDLRHTPRLVSSLDAFTWANPGPGAKRGLNRLLGRDKDANLSGPEMLRLMRELMELASEALRGEDSMFEHLEMRDIEHSLCETDKWLRAKSGIGRPKQMYP